MSLKEALDSIKYDVRLVDYNLKHKKISDSELNEHLSALKDLSQNSKKVELDSDTDSFDTEMGMSNQEEGYNPIY